MEKNDQGTSEDRRAGRPRSPTGQRDFAPVEYAIAGCLIAAAVMLVFPAIGDATLAKLSDLLRGLRQ